MPSDIDEIRAWLLGNARSEYWRDREGGKADSDPFSWAAAKLSGDLVSRHTEEMLSDVARCEADRIESWLRNAAPFMISKCKTVAEVCDKLADYVKRRVY